MAGPLNLAIIGLGATGCALLPMACTFPFHRITLIDGDSVELANLPRQPLYGPQDAGRPKVHVAQERVAHLNTEREVVARNIFIDGGNIGELLAGTMVVADCTDDIHARDLLGRYCHDHRIPLVTAPIHGRQVQAIALHGDERRSLTLQDIFPGRSGPDQDGCEMRDVPVDVPAMAAALMIARLRELLEGGSAAPYLDILDTGNGRWLRIAPPTPPHDDDLIA